MSWQPPAQNPAPFDPGKKTPPPKKKKPGGGLDLGSPGAYAGPKKKGSTGERAFFNAFMKAHPAMAPYANAIWHAAGRYGGITATQLAAVLFAESGGNPNARSGAGALGLAQIFDNVASPRNANGDPFFRGNLNISDKDKKNWKFAIQYAAWRLGGYANATGTNDIDQIWLHAYNPGAIHDPKLQHFISQNLPKGYPKATITGTSPADSAQQSVSDSVLRASIGDPYVAGLNKSGFVTTRDPKKAIAYDGLPLTRSSFLSLQRQLETYYISYTGQRPSRDQVLQYVKMGWSPYSLTIALSKSKSFTKSPIWKAQAPAYKDASKEITEPGQAAPTSLIRQAILNNWSQSTFQAVLRSQPGYVKSNEFKGNTATMMNVHQSIMGTPDDKSMNAIKQATLAGWQPDQYAAWLRSQPQYVQSPEYQTKTLSFLSSLGLITGQQPILKRGQQNPNANPNKDGYGPLPNDKRVPAGKLNNEEDTIAGYR